VRFFGDVAFYFFPILALILYQPVLATAALRHADRFGNLDTIRGIPTGAMI
jgi:hypothetical protein